MSGGLWDDLKACEAALPPKGITVALPPLPTLRVRVSLGGLLVLAAMLAAELRKPGPPTDVE